MLINSQDDLVPRGPPLQKAVGGFPKAEADEKEDQKDYEEIMQDGWHLF